MSQLLCFLVVRGLEGDVCHGRPGLIAFRAFLHSMGSLLFVAWCEIFSHGNPRLNNQFIFVCALCIKNTAFLFIDS